MRKDKRLPLEGKLSAVRLTDEVSCITESYGGNKRQEYRLVRRGAMRGKPCAVGRSYYAFDVSRGEQKAMPACEQPPAWRAVVYSHFTSRMEEISFLE
jgi:hypothetical protein